MDCELRRIEQQALPAIKPLWEQLNKLHLADSRYFKEYYKTLLFERRSEKFKALAEDDVFIEGVFPAGSDRPVGYCISTVDHAVGEIDSLFIEEGYRRHGYGGMLVDHSVRWLKRKGCTTIRVAVADGHESVFGFYQQFGFYPRLTYLQLKEKR